MVQGETQMKMIEMTEDVEFKFLQILENVQIHSVCASRDQMKEIFASDLKVCSEYVHLIDMKAQHPQDLCPRLTFLSRHRLQLSEAKLVERK